MVAVCIEARAAASPNGGHADPRRYSRASLIAVIAATEAWQKHAEETKDVPEAAVIVPEQTRFFTSNREVFKRYFEPLNDGMVVRDDAGALLIQALELGLFE